ncbi:bactofilin family protein [Amedibacillus sp. YH-ame10]
MKWYERQKKLFAEQEQQTKDGEMEIETTKNEEALESVFMEAVNEYSIEENAIVSYEEDAQPSLDDAINEEVKKVKVANTVISETTSIQGNLEVDGDLYISGNIVGNISCSGDIHMDNGCINGDVIAMNTYVHDATITGNITATNTLELLSNAQVFGNVSGTSLSCDAHIKGDIDIKGELLLMQHTSIEGNLSAYFLKTEKGASIKGQCCIITE